MSVKIYPVQKQEYACTNYTVKINGQPVEVDTARVSALPFNRRWPGHQRQIEQTELINFISFSCDGETSLEITPKEKFDDFKIRPQSLNFQSKITADNTIKITMTKPAYFTVEPFGRRNALHIFADIMSKYSIDKEENTIYFGEGIHEAGLIELHSNQTLFIDEGAVVYGSILAQDAENIKILGHGILDNSHNKEIILFEYNADGNTEEIENAYRPHTIQIEYCTNVEIDGITIRDSLQYNIRPLGCKNLSIKNVKIIGCWRYNSDGIDMHNCENVEIDTCFLRTYDDAICVKGFDFYYVEDPVKATLEATYHNGQVYDTFYNVRVRNCTIWNDWGKCLEIGAETRAREIYNVLFEDCDIIHTSIAVLTCSNGDNAHVHDITYQNINIEYDEKIPTPSIQKNDADTYVDNNPDYAPSLIEVGIYYYEEYSKGVLERGHNTNITFRNINLYGRQKPIIKVEGYDNTHVCRNVFIDNLRWNEKKINNLEDITYKINQYCENISIQ